MKDITQNEEKPSVLFVYGTLMSKHGRNHMLRGLNNSHAVLRGYKRVWPAREPFPIIVRDLKTEVSGEVYWPVSHTLWQALDRVEGEGHLYHRIIVDVSVPGEPNPKKACMYFPSTQLIEWFAEESGED